MNAIAGISGGRTSARMAYMLPSTVVLCFQNTGREVAGTYDFIAKVEQDIGREIVRIEYRAPPRGEAPKFATFEVVDHAHLSRRGEPFIDMLECARSYRAKHKNEGPIAPWARQRICTAHLKIKTQNRYTASLGWGKPGDYVEYIGLRADEPGRVAKMRSRNSDRDTLEEAPLADAGIIKADVLEFWASKPFDLDVPEHLGNCDLCFLKDEADLATAMMDESADPNFWIGIEDNYAPMRRGRSSYRQVLAEAPDRMRIRAALAQGEEPTGISLPPRRVRLIVAQETSARSSFSCECDAAKADDFDDDDVQMSLSLGAA